MRRFRLNIALLMTGMAVGTGMSVWLLTRGMWAQGLLVALAAMLCGAGIWHLQGRLIRMMSAFVSALEMNDATLRVEAGGDAELRKMSEAMNRISDLYRENLRELETRKLYYDRILRIMTHEMRNGITPLIALTADMESNPEQYKGELLRETAVLLHSQVGDMKRFLDSYYTLTHLPDPKIETFRAGDYFKSVRQLVASELKQRGLPPDTVSYTVAEDMELSIDPALIKQVMINIIRNALDAVDGKEGGRVEVVLTVSESHPYLTVSDNGGGFADSVLSNLFQPFFTTKEGGSGVGLSISRQIVRRHGGELLIRNQAGRGAIVTITLP